MDVKLSWLNSTSYEISDKQPREVTFNIFTTNNRYDNHVVYHPDLNPNFPGPVKGRMSIRAALHLLICSFIHLLANSQNFSLLNCSSQLQYSLQTTEAFCVETHPCLKPCWMLLLRVIGPQLGVGQCWTDHKSLADRSTHRQPLCWQTPGLETLQQFSRAAFKQKVNLIEKLLSQSLKLPDEILRSKNTSHLWCKYIHFYGGAPWHSFFPAQQAVCWKTEEWLLWTMKLGIT